MTDERNSYGSDIALLNRALKDLEWAVQQTTKRHDDALVALDHAMIQLQDGQSRFMSGIFETVNENSARVRGIEQRVLWLEHALRGALIGEKNDPRDQRPHSDHTQFTFPTGDTRIGADSPREGGSEAGARSAWESDGGGGD